MTPTSTNDENDEDRSAPAPAPAHPLLQVADALVQQIDDWPGLMSLAMTCRTFYDRVVRVHRLRLQAAFDNLEVYRTEGGRAGDCGDFPAGLLHKPCTEWTWPTCVTPVAAYGEAELLARERRDDGRGDGRPKRFRPVPVNHDIFRWGHGRLRTQQWLPCYGCRTVKHRATAFFKDQSWCVFDLFQLRCAERRCIACSVHEPERFMEPWYHSFPRRSRYVPRRFRQPGRYIQDMPRNVPGYRLRCSICRNVEWVAQKPRKAQRLKRLCDSCYARCLEESCITPEEALGAEWVRLAEIEVQDSDSGPGVGDDVDDDHDGNDKNETPASSLEVWNIYEVLSAIDET